MPEETELVPILNVSEEAFKASLLEQDKKPEFQALSEGLRKAKILSAEDLAFRINVRG